MGKVKSDIPRGRFVFRNGPNPSGERALNIQYVLDSVPVYRSTGIFLHPDNWNAAKQEVRRYSSEQKTRGFQIKD